MIAVCCGRAQPTLDGGKLAYRGPGLYEKCIGAVTGGKSVNNILLGLLLPFLPLGFCIGFLSSELKSVKPVNPFSGRDNFLTDAFLVIFFSLLS